MSITNTLATGRMSNAQEASLFEKTGTGLVERMRELGAVAILPLAGDPNRPLTRFLNIANETPNTFGQSGPAPDGITVADKQMPPTCGVTESAFLFSESGTTRSIYTGNTGIDRSAWTGVSFFMLERQQGTLASRALASMGHSNADQACRIFVDSNSGGGGSGFRNRWLEGRWWRLGPAPAADTPITKDWEAACYTWGSEQKLYHSAGIISPDGGTSPAGPGGTSASFTATHTRSSDTQFVIGRHFASSAFLDDMNLAMFAVFPRELTPAEAQELVDLAMGDADNRLPATDAANVAGGWYGDASVPYFLSQSKTDSDNLGIAEGHFLAGDSWTLHRGYGFLGSFGAQFDADRRLFTSTVGLTSGGTSSAKGDIPAGRAIRDFIIQGDKIDPADSGDIEAQTIFLNDVDRPAYSSSGIAWNNSPSNLDSIRFLTVQMGFPDEGDAVTGSARISLVARNDITTDAITFDTYDVLNANDEPVLRSMLIPQQSSSITLRAGFVSNSGLGMPANLTGDFGVICSALARADMTGGGASMRFMRGIGGRGTWELLDALRFENVQAWSTYLAMHREAMIMGGVRPYITFWCEGGQNDRTDDPVGQNTQAAYARNLRAQADYITGIWKRNNWPLEELSIVFWPNFSVNLAQGAELDSYATVVPKLAKQLQDEGVVGGVAAYATANGGIAAADWGPDDAATTATTTRFFIDTAGATGGTATLSITFSNGTTETTGAISLDGDYLNAIELETALEGFANITNATITELAATGQRRAWTQVDVVGTNIPDEVSGGLARVAVLNTDNLVGAGAGASAGGSDFVHPSRNGFDRIMDAMFTQAALAPSPFATSSSVYPRRRMRSRIR